MDGVSILQLTSLASIVTASIFLTYVAKRALADVPVASRLPVWLYTSTIAGVLTYVAVEVLGTLQGKTGVLVIDGMINGALASGIREWFATVDKPLAASKAAKEASFEAEIKRRMGIWFLPLLLVGGLAVGAAGCAGVPANGPVITPADQAQVRAAAAKALGGIEIAGVIVRDGMRLAIDLQLPPAVMDPLRTAVQAANPEVQSLITQIGNATRVATVESLARGVAAVARRVAEALRSTGHDRLAGVAVALDAAAGALEVLR